MGLLVEFFKDIAFWVLDPEASLYVTHYKGDFLPLTIMSYRQLVEASRLFIKIK